MRNDGSPFAFYKFGPSRYDFWRCYTCGSLFTYEQERKRAAAMESDPQATMCPCGSLRYKPSRPKWYQWLQLSVMKYTAKLILARGVGPWAEQRAPWLLPHIAKLVAQ